MDNTPSSRRGRGGRGRGGRGRGRGRGGCQPFAGDGCNGSDHTIADANRPTSTVNSASNARASTLQLTNSSGSSPVARSNIASAGARGRVSYAAAVSGRGSAASTPRGRDGRHGHSASRTSTNHENAAPNHIVGIAKASINGLSNGHTLSSCAAQGSRESSSFGESPEIEHSRNYRATIRVSVDGDEDADANSDSDSDFIAEAIAEAMEARAEASARGHAVPPYETLNLTHPDEPGGNSSEPQQAEPVPETNSGVAQPAPVYGRLHLLGLPDLVLSRICEFTLTHPEPVVVDILLRTWNPSGARCHPLSFNYSLIHTNRHMYHTGFPLMMRSNVWKIDISQLWTERKSEWMRTRFPYALGLDMSWPSICSVEFQSYREPYAWPRVARAILAIQNAPNRGPRDLERIVFDIRSGAALYEDTGNVVIDKASDEIVESLAKCGVKMPRDGMWVRVCDHGEQDPEYANRQRDSLAKHLRDAHERDEHGDLPYEQNSRIDDDSSDGEGITYHY